MLSERDVLRVAGVLDGELVLSTYIATASTVATGRGPWQEDLDRILKQLGGRVAGASGPEFAAYDRARAHLASWLSQGVPVPGIATLVTPERVHLAEALEVPVATSAAWGRGARILPLLDTMRPSSRNGLGPDQLARLVHEGRAVVGVPDTLEALGCSAVSRLLLTPAFADRHAAKADRIARLAEEQRAEVTLAHGLVGDWLDANGTGVGCVLRPDHPARHRGPG